MSGAQPMRYSLARPAGWIVCLPSRDLADPDAVAEFVAGVGLSGAARRRFQRDVVRLAARAAADDVPHRLRWLYLPDRDSGAVVATMTVELVQDFSAGVDSVAAALESALSPEGTDVWRRSFRVTTLAGRKAVSGSELLQVRPVDGEASQLNERYVAILFTPVIGVVLELTISTYDLGAFEDIVAYGDVVADSIAFPAVGAIA